MNPQSDQGTDRRLARVAALAPARRSRVERLRPERPEREDDRLASLLAAEVGRNRYGEHLMARQWYSKPEMCGADPPTIRLLLPPTHSSAAARHASEPERWLFLDTETTGLAGGTGTYAFLVGLAWWDAGGLQVEQFFMRDHGEEHSILLALARRLRERPVLVTFNGKSFDWPLLETRYRMTRCIEPPVPAAHLDLLHPARHLWGRQLGSVRLAELERSALGCESLGWSRRDDLDSSLIPEIYFDYLRGGPAEPVARIFRHNSMDLRGLAALAGRVLRALGETGKRRSLSSFEMYGAARLLRRRGERAQARELCERAIEAGLPGTAARAARHELARMAKRDRDFRRAFELWSELADEAGPSVEACEQLAIHYERRARDVQAAATMARRGLAELRRLLRLGLVHPQRHARLAERFERRLARLARKAVRLPAAPSLRAARYPDACGPG